MKKLIIFALIASFVVSCTKTTVGDDDKKPQGFTTKTYIVPSYRMNNDTMVITMKDTTGTVHLAWKANPDDRDKFKMFTTLLQMKTNTGRGIAKYVNYTKVGYHVDYWYEGPYLKSKAFGYMQDGTFSVTLTAGEVVQTIEVYNSNVMTQPNL